jgi:putative hydrolase of the HAD superfamily
VKNRQLFFDLDRTLWDFETNSKNALYALFHEYNLEDEIEHFLQFHHVYVQVNADLWQKYGKKKISKDELRDQRFVQTLSKLGVNDHQLAQKMSDGYISTSPHQTTLFPNALDVLKSLQQENYRIHLITNGFKEVQFIKLEKSGLLDFFDVILCSEEVGHTKPHVEIFREAEKLTNCRPQDAFMIGDDFKADVTGALNAGWTAIHFDPEKKYRSDGTVKRIRDLKELPELIAQIPIVS